MAVLMSNQSGNFTTAATWSLIDSTSYSNSEAASTASTTSWVASASFSPGAVTLDGLAIKVSAHGASGNIAVKLGKSGSITAISIANPTHVTSANHGLVSGEAILIAGTNSTPALTGPYTVTVLDGNTFTVPVNVTVAGTAGTWATVLATITSNTLVATPVFTTSVAHGLTAGSSQILIKGSTSTPSYNGTWTVATTPTATTFTLTGAPSAVGGVTGWGVYNITAAGDTVLAIAANDLQTVNTGTAVGWALFKFASSVTLTSGATYTAQIASSVAGGWTPWRTATAGDWSRSLRTTTTQAPAAADSTLICGQYSGVGSNSAYTVTADSGLTSATSYGGMEICGNGTLSYTTAASVNPYLKIAGNVGTTTTGIQGYTGGTFSMGTQGTPIPSTSTASLEFACTSAVQYGFDIKQNGFTFNTGGNALTVNSALLAADASAAATSLTTNVSTGWLSGAAIGIASTTQTRAQTEKVTLSANASGTSLSVSALANAHGGGGTALVVAELINLSRNVSIFSTSTANTTYVNIGAAGTTANLQATEFYNMGSATASKHGIDVATTTSGSCVINNCSIHDFTPASAIGTNVTGAANGNVTVSNTVYYNITAACLSTVATTQTTNTYSSIIAMLSGSTPLIFGDLMGTISNVTAVSGTTQGMSLSQTLTAGTSPGTISGLTAHSNTGPGINFTNLTIYGNNPFMTASNMTSWRNTTNGMTFSNTFGIIADGAGALNGQLFGNATSNITFSGSCANVYVRNMISNAGTTLTCPLGIGFSNDMKDAYIDNSTFGATTTHATADMSITAANIFTKFFARNCSFNSATTLANQNANMIEGGEISSARHQQTAGNHRSFRKFGTISPDTVIWHNGSPSTRLTPNTANQKLWSGYKKVAVPNGQTATINVWVRKSVVGDGTAYNGNQPRLIQRADAATGNNTDTVLATATNAANGAWQLLTATISAVNDNCAITLYIDCDGTTGWVNVDDWLVQ